LEAFLGLFVVFLVLLVFALPVWAMVRASDAKQKIASLTSEVAALRDRIRDLTQRVSTLEKSRTVAPAAAASEAAPRSTTPASALVATLTPPQPVVVAQQPKPEPPPIVEPVATPAVEIKPPTPAPRPPAAPAEPDIAQVPPNFGVPDSATQPANAFAARVSAPNSTTFTPPKSAPARNATSFEEKFGESWLNKIGITALVIGMAFLLNYSMHYLGPAGKIALGYACSAALIGLGAYGETHERYRMPSRAVLGGGWALAYFTTYALHNVNAVKLVDNAFIGFALLFAVAAAMVVHSLRYESELTTGFAYLLGFTAVAVSEIPFGALFASAILAGSLALVIRIRKWYIVEPLAIIATYFVHWLWLQQTYDAIGGHKPFAQLNVSAALIFVYWAIYMVSYFLREPSTPQERSLLGVSFVLNAIGLLVLLHEQSFHPEWRFWFLFIVGLVYFAIAAWARTQKKETPYQLASTMGTILTAAAIPYKFSGGRMEIIWLIEVEALLFAGWRLREQYLRILAAITGVLLAGYIGFDEVIVRIFSNATPNKPLAWILIAVAVAYFFNGALKSRTDDLSGIDEAWLTASPILATASMLAAAWVALDSMWVGLVWIVAGAALAELGRDTKARLLRYCGHAAVALAVIRLFYANLNDESIWHDNITLRLVTVGISCLILYIASRRHIAAGDHSNSKSPEWFLSNGGVAMLYSAAATVLAMILVALELHSGAIALAWGLLGLVLVEAAGMLGDLPLRWEGALALLMSFQRIFAVDLNAPRTHDFLALPFISVISLAAIYYYVAASDKEELWLRFAALWFGTLAIAGLLRFQIGDAWVAVAWAALAAVLYALSRTVNRDAFRWQCYALVILTALRCVFDNFERTKLFFPESSDLTYRTVTLVLASTLIYIMFAASRIWKTEPDEGETKVASLDWIAEREHHLFFFTPTILLTILIALEIRRNYLTAAWGVEAVVIFLVVLRMDERSYRWFSLGLLSLCVIRIVLFDVWALDPLGRIISFLGLGAALLLVSFLYARHREVLRKVL
jgi:uncharacterized membrane protein